MYKHLRTLIILGLLAIGAAALVRFGAANAQGSQPQTVANEETTTVERGSVQIVVSATGPIQPKQKVTMAFPASGNVVAINVQEGDHVLKGQTLAILDQTTALDNVLLAQARVNQQQIMLNRITAAPRQVDLNVAEAQLKLAQARLAESGSGVDPLQTKIAGLNVEVAKNNLWQSQLTRDANDKTKEDLKKDPRTAPQANALPSDTQNNATLQSKEFDVQIAQANADAAKHQTGNVGSISQAQAQVVSAQNALDTLKKGGDKQDITRAQANLDAAKAALAQAKTTLEKTKLVAPFDGVVATLNLNLGQPAPQTAAVLLDTSSFYVDLPVDEVDIAKIGLDQSVDLKFDSLPGTPFKGKVTYIAPAATKTGDTVTYTVRVEIDPSGHSLISTMSTTASIITGESTNVLRVRNRFIRLDRAKNQAFVALRQPDGTYKEVEVKLGLHNETFTEVTSGLSEGDVLVNPEVIQKLPKFGSNPNNQPQG